MHKAARTLYSEHRSLSAVLSGLTSLAQMAKDPELRPDFAVLHAMIYYIDTFPERLHHPKEDEFLFPRLAAKSEDAAALIESLKVDHVTGAKMVRDLERSLNEFESIWPKGAEKFADAVAAYCRFHWNHMTREEHDLIPLAEKHLSEADWAAIEAAFAENNEPIADLRDTDYAALFQRILKLAPAPIGLGERWKRESSGRRRH